MLNGKIRPVWNTWVEMTAREVAVATKMKSALARMTPEGRLRAAKQEPVPDRCSALEPTDCTCPLCHVCTSGIHLQAFLSANTTH